MYAHLFLWPHPNSRAGRLWRWVYIGCHTHRGAVEDVHMKSTYNFKLLKTLSANKSRPGTLPPFLWGGRKNTGPEVSRARFATCHLSQALLLFLTVWHLPLWTPAFSPVKMTKCFSTSTRRGIVILGRVHYELLRKKRGKEDRARGREETAHHKNEIHREFLSLLSSASFILSVGKGAQRLETGSLLVAEGPRSLFVPCSPPHPIFSSWY